MLEFLGQLNIPPMFFYAAGFAFGMPIGLLGVADLYRKIKSHIMKRKGYMEFGFIKENFQIYTDFIKPIDGEFRRSIGSEIRKYRFSPIPGKSLYDGSEVKAFFNEKSGEQIIFDNNLKDDVLSARDSDNYDFRVFNLGISAGKKMNEGAGQILGILSVIGIAIIIILLFKTIMDWAPAIKMIPSLISQSASGIIK